MSHSRTYRRTIARTAAAAALAASTLAVTVTDATAHGPGGAPGAVFTMTNDAAGNQVLAYQRDSAGQLRLAGRYATGGEGTSRIRLSSQNSVVLTQSKRFLLVANVGSDEISVFRVRGAALELVDVEPSGGQTPNSVTVDGDLVYVLNNGDAGVGNIHGFRLGTDGDLTALSGSSRPLSAAGSNPAQISITPDGRSLVVTEKATNRIDTWQLGADDRPGTGTFSDSAGATPFGFDFTRSGTFVVTNAEEGRIGEATASSYSLTRDGAVRTISASVPDGRSEVCWTVISKNQKYAYITNFGDGTISSYTIGADGSLALLESIAATTTLDQLSIRDAGLTADGRYLYAIDITSRKVHGWAVGHDGGLRPIGAFPGLPGTVAGLATA